MVVGVRGFMKVSALIPVKSFTQAKQRLTPLLGEGEREVLAEAMLRDVLGRVVLARGLEAIYVVTADERVSTIAESLGARVLREKGECGETEAVQFALCELKQMGVAVVLVIPADIPLVRTSDIEDLIAPAWRDHSGAPFVVLVPSHDRLGTNALLLSPPDVIGLRFGYDSFSYHLRQAAGRGIPFQVMENARIGLDIDEPSDLARFLSAGEAGGESYARVAQMGLLEPSPNAWKPGNS
ncbi:MAG: 2-phospho-L-lactate guanylyltransferase [Deltaproteobacteria bacterium]|nr:2-phospho-L-lactate guanylyltransferase [Deltaproteobacteria bacterium]